MPEQTIFPSEDWASPYAQAGSPRHGFRGEGDQGRPPLPKGLAVAISREAGARGGAIARRAGEKLGWQVYSQELMEYMAQEGAIRKDLLDPMASDTAAWVEEQLNSLLKAQNLSRNPSVMELARMILSLGVHGEVVLLGRGAGCILPARSTLNVRLVAPQPDRIAYISQWMRLTEDEATEYVKKHDIRRAEFLATHFHRKPSDVHQYDMVLNSSLLGEERCADLIVQAARAKSAGMGRDFDLNLSIDQTPTA